MTFVLLLLLLVVVAAVAAQTYLLMKKRPEAKAAFERAVASPTDLPVRRLLLMTYS